MLGLILFSSTCQRHPDAIPDFPRVILWAWERREDLRWLDPSQTAVAYLAETIFLGKQRAFAKTRLQPLRTPENCKLIAVIRLEGPGTPANDLHWISAEIVKASSARNAGAVQLDFDAVRSQRWFYRQLVAEVRRDLPRPYPILMTALVSWCTWDRWIDSDFEISDAVPMYFRMGPEAQFRSVEIRSRMCQNEVGLSTDELRKVRLRQHIFLFSPRAWTSGSYRTALAQMETW